MKPFQLIFNYARRYTFSLVVTAVSMLVLVGIQLLIPWIIKLLVAEVTAPGASLAHMN
jgi:ATP-binding cassette subfamily B protein/subfamily B ATP-binding cassette protein MsbA